ncbi:MAG: hypothetical protein R2716_10455 [Microthrixaceae bacterium]
MIDAHQGEAEASGARAARRFDSIPSDLGVWFTQQRSIEQLGEPCERISMRVHATKGGASGGTIVPMLNLVEEAAGDPALRRLLADPCALNPPDLRSGPRQPDTTRPTRDRDTGRWLAPFVMAAVNTCAVQRTSALLGRPWGRSSATTRRWTWAPVRSVRPRPPPWSQVSARAWACSRSGPTRNLAKGAPKPDGPTPRRSEPASSTCGSREPHRPASRRAPG